jgi:phosphoglycerate kinase
VRDNVLKYLNVEQLTAVDKDVFRAKTVFLRVDTNSTVVDGEIKPNERIVAAARAIRKMATTYGAKVIVGTHNGREGDVSFVGTGFGLKSLRKQRLVGEIKYIGNTFEDDHLNDEAIREIKRLQSGEALLLENLRFLPGEAKSLSPEEHAKSDFIRDLIEKCRVEYYVLDAFSVAHRSHRSVVGFKDIPNLAGPELNRELSAITELKTRFLNGETPSSIFILGGKKVQDYFSLMERALKDNLVRKILTGGLLANLCLFAAGYNIGEETKRLLMRRDSKGKSVWDYLPKIKELLQGYPEVFVLPVDVAGGDGSARVLHKVEDVPEDFCVYDIGNETVGLYEETIEEVIKTNPTGREVMVYIKGPVGAYDLSPEYNFGSSQLLSLIRQPRYRDKIYTVIGGGDTTAMLREFSIPESSLIHKHISLAGGALIKMLAGETLPGVQALEESYERFHKALGVDE